MELTLANVVGASAGLLIVGVGVFVLAARPESPLHRFFFLLALLDGASTTLLRLFLMADEAWWQRYFLGAYFYFFIAFIALLACFGILFPKPLASTPQRYAALAAVALASGALLVVYTLDHALFWSSSSGSAIAAVVEPVGNVVNVGFVLVIAILVVRLTQALRADPSRSHRRQASFVLGGMALAYLPYPWTVVVQDLAAQGLAPFLAGRWDRVLAHWVFLGAAATSVVSVVLLWRADKVPEHERRFALLCYAGVAALAITSLLVPTGGFGIALRAGGLLAYPVLLGYAIARYEVFDIDRQLRRAATITLSLAAIGAAFIVAEDALSQLLQQRLLAGISSAWVSGGIAAIATGLASIPIAHASRKAAARIVPELSRDELHERKLEIYRHSLAGALADGILREGESRTLSALRASLGISDHEHKRLIAEVSV